jgi:hypothetical protein
MGSDGLCRREGRGLEGSTGAGSEQSLWRCQTMAFLASLSMPLAVAVMSLPRHVVYACSLGG